MDKYRRYEDENPLLSGEQTALAAVGFILLAIFGPIVAMAIHDAIGNSNLFTALVISISMTIVCTIQARERIRDVGHDIWWRVLTILSVSSGIATVVLAGISWSVATL